MKQCFYSLADRVYSPSNNGLCRRKKDSPRENIRHKTKEISFQQTSKELKGITRNYKEVKGITRNYNDDKVKLMKTK